VLPVSGQPCSRLSTQVLQKKKYQVSSNFSNMASDALH